MRLVFFSFIIVFLIGCTSSVRKSVQTQSAQLLWQIELEGPPDRSEDHPVILKTTVTNITNRAVAFLAWNTPFEPISEDIFELYFRSDVRADNEWMRVGYTGPIVKRAPPVEENYVLLEPGEKRTISTNLSNFYELSDVGQYKTSLDTQVRGLQIVEREIRINQFENLEIFSVNEGPIIFSLTRSSEIPGGRIRDFTQLKELATGAGSQNCNNNQHSKLGKAYGGTKNISRISKTYLNQTANGGSIYRRWFGAHTSGRYGVIRSTFDTIDARLRDGNVIIDCACSRDDLYAYVYANKPYQIWVCGAFWRAPVFGRDSQTGTLVHEMSHFDVVAGTRDHAYGEVSVKKLARDNAEKAIRNADSIEYFAEDEPIIIRP